MFLKWWFSNNYSFYLYSLSPDYLFISLCQYWLRDSYFIQWIVICYYHYFDTLMIPDLATGDSFKLTSLFFWHVPIILSTLLTFPPNKVFQAHVGLSLPCLGISYFSKESWFLLVDKVTFFLKQLRVNSHHDAPMPTLKL